MPSTDVPAAGVGATTLKDSGSSAIRRMTSPGGIGDRIVFGYMFRVWTVVAAMAVMIVILVAWGLAGGWHRDERVLILAGTIGSIMVALGERLRMRVYERRYAVVDEDERPGAPLTDDRTPEPPDRWYLTTKRMLDLVIAVWAAVALMPVMVLVFILVRIDSPGPILFGTPSIGADGREILMYKIRTITTTPGARDPVTRAGRFLRASSLDHLPSIFNVINGDISLVGPHIRPATGEGVERTKAIARLAKPGLISPDVDMPDEERGEAVLRYLRERSLWHDMGMMVRGMERVLLA